MDKKSNSGITQHESDISHSMAHYLLTIHKLKEDRGYARVTDIARDLELTKGSVSTAINNLKKRGLVEEEMGTKFLVLTEVGHTEVHEILGSRVLLYYFLKDFLHVSETVAKRDACVMEHLVSAETREKFFLFMKSVACKCDSSHQDSDQPFKTDLNLCDYDAPSDFIRDQKGSNLIFS